MVRYWERESAKGKGKVGYTRESITLGTTIVAAVVAVHTGFRTLPRHVI